MTQQSHTEVFLVRHGQTDSNVAGLFHGATDIPLNDLGQRQAERVAARIQQMSAIQSLHSSPLQRALNTALAISRRTRLTPRLHPGLMEMNFGHAEGLPWEVLVERYEEVLVRFQDFSDMDVAFPGGESRGAFHRRIRETVDRVINDHQGERLVIVAHAGVIASALAQMLGEDVGDWRKYQVSNCSVTHVELASTGPVAHLMNDVVHLEDIHVETTVGG